MLITQANGGGGGGGFGGGSTHRGNVNVRLVPRDERDAHQRTDRHAAAPRAVGHPRRDRPRPPVRRPAEHDARHGRRRRRRPPVDRDPRPRPRRRRSRSPRTSRPCSIRRPGIADSRLQREEGRPELAVRVDRDKAALLGLTVTGVANTIRTNVAGTQAAMFRDAGNEYPIVVRLRQSDREEVVGSRRRAAERRRRPGAAGQERHGRSIAAPARCRSSARTRSACSASTPKPRSRSAKRSRRCRRACGEINVPQGLRGRLRQRGRGTGQVVPRAAAGADPRDRAGLHGDGVAVRVAARSVHHHLLDSAGGDRRGRRADADRHAVQHAGLHRRDHAGRHRGQQRHPAGRLHQHAAPSRQDGAARGHRAGRPPPPAPDSDDLALHRRSAWCRWRSASAKAPSCRRRWRASSSAAC